MAGNLKVIVDSTGEENRGRGMARKRYSIPFEFGTSKGDFGFIANETTYDEIKTELGVNDVTDAELKNVLMNLDADDIQIGKIRIQYKVGDKNRSTTVMYDPKKSLSEVASALVGKAYKTGTITAADRPKRRILI